MNKEIVIDESFLEKLSSEQRQFVEFNSDNALVSASAGSGKTFTMISKLVALLVYYDVDIDDLLVVTFTNAAGEELKQKLYNNLLKEINTTTNTSIDKDRLYNMLERINTADIGTLHSVCYKYIMKYFYKCGISPTSSILLEEDTNYLLNDAINRVLDSYTDDEDFYKLFSSYSSRRNNTKIVDMVKSIYYFMESLPDVDSFVENIVNNKANTNLDTNVSANYILNALKDSFDECAKMFVQLGMEARSLGLDKYVANIESILARIREYRECDSYRSAALFVKKGFVFESVSKPRKAEGLVLDFVERHKEAKDVFTKVHTMLKSYFVDIDFDNLMNIENNALCNVNKCLEIVSRIKEEYQKAKSAIDGLDYSDLEKGMIRLLEDELVLKELKSKYKYIFVDEYQDINNVQESILTKVSNGMNLYMIGDVKQSIYGFRLCTPDIFIEKYNSYKSKKSKSKSIEFNKNFRSVDGILQFVNYIFSQIGTAHTMGIDYKDSSMLVCGKEVPSNYENEIDVEFNLIEKPPKAKVVEDDEESPDDSEDVEARLIVGKVESYLKKSYKNLDTGKMVQIEPKDIAILIRDKSTLMLKVYGELQKRSIAVSTELKLNLFDAYEVNLLVSYLKLLSNPNDDLSLATVLRSGIVGLRDKELLDIRNSGSHTSFVEAVNEYMAKDDSVAYKINKLYDDMAKYRFDLSTSTLKEIVLDILSRYSLNNYFYSFADGGQKMKNIEIFLNIISNKNYEYNLSKFLEYVELLSVKEYSCTVQSGINAVTIITMHKSKGLDYPVVIVAGLGKKFSNKSTSADAIMTNELGIGLKYNDPITRTTTHTLSHLANKLSKELSERKEQIRLYYVALTRAKNYLCLIGAYEMKKIPNVKNKDILKCTSFMELTLLSMCKNGDISKLEDVQNSISTYNNLRFSTRRYTFDDINSGDIVKKMEIKENKLMVDTELSNELRRSFSYIYPYEKSKAIALKTSVSTMLNEADYVEQNYEPQELVIGESVSSNIGIEIGNAYHAIMEKIDYKSENDVIDILSSLVSQGVIEDSISKMVDTSRIEKAIGIVSAMITPNTRILKEQQFMIRDKHSALVKSSKDDTVVMVQGIIDLVLIENGVATLIDFKTNKVSSEKELIDRYLLQIDLYAKAIEGATNAKVENRYLYSFGLNKLIKL